MKRKGISGGLIAVIIIAAGALSFNRYGEKDAKGHLSTQAIDMWNQHLTDSCSKFLKNGDLILRSGVEAISQVLSRMNLYNKTYSHCGIVVFENGKPFVYHSIGGEENPNACIRREPLNVFLNPGNNFGFAIARYDMPDSTLQKLEETVKRFYAEKRKFDPDFDLKTDDKLYCAEFVYKAVIAATGDSSYIQPVTAYGHTYVGVDNLFVNKHTQLVCEVKFK